MSESGQIIIAGGSGFLGLSLAMHLTTHGSSVVILSRNSPKVAGPWRHVAWDARSLGEWAKELDGAAGLVNLAGRSVDCIKTPDHCDEILRSRVEATRVLGQAMRMVERPPPVWVQMSTAGGPPADSILPFGDNLRQVASNGLPGWELPRGCSSVVLTGCDTLRREATLGLQR